MARFSVLPAAAVVDSRLTLRELSVLAAIGIHTDRNGWCYPSSERIGQMLGIQGAMVRKSIARLAEAGYVHLVGRKRDDGGQTSNAIRILMDAVHPAEAMRIKLDATHPPATSEGTPPVPPEGTPPVPPGGTRKIPLKDPIERKIKSICADAPKKGTRLPKDWQPDAALADFAAGRGFTGAALAEELDRFRDYWASQPGQRGTKLDWPATFRNWLRNSRGTRHAPAHPADRRPSLVERVAAHAHRIAAAEAISDGHPLAAHDADLRPPLDGTARRIV